MEGNTGEKEMSELLWRPPSPGPSGEGSLGPPAPGPVASALTCYRGEREPLPRKGLRPS